MMSALKYKIIYDGHCQLCQQSVQHLKAMDWFRRCEYINFQTVFSLKSLHPSLNQELVASQLHFITPDGRIYGGFLALRQIAWIMPMLYPLLFVMYLPTASKIGSRLYRWIAKNRYSFNFHQNCKENYCYL